MDNLMMLHFSSCHPKHIKKVILYKQALCIHRICSDEEERDGHLKVLKDALIRTEFDAQLIDRPFRFATTKNHYDLLRRQTQDTTDRVSFIIQYFPRAEKPHHVLRCLQHVIDDDEHLAKVFPTPPLLAFKQLPNLKQTIVRSKLLNLQDNIYHNTTQPQGCPEAWYTGKAKQMLRKWINGHRATIARQECFLAVGEHFSSLRLNALDLR
eukprot:g23890.t1